MATLKKGSAKPTIVRRVGRGHVLRPPRNSLQGNYLNDQAKQAIKDAAGSGVSITF